MSLHDLPYSHASRPLASGRALFFGRHDSRIYVSGRASWIESLLRLMRSAFCCIGQGAWPTLPCQFRILNLNAQYRSIKPEIVAVISKVIGSCQFVLGTEVAVFEQEFAPYCGATEGIVLNSGTSALNLALLATGVGPSDEVITVPFTFVASVAAILYAGATGAGRYRSRHVDHENPAAIEAAIAPRTKAILPAHLYSHPADMDPILEVTGRRGLFVIEDAAQAHGAKYKGRSIGSVAFLSDQESRQYCVCDLWLGDQNVN